MVLNAEKVAVLNAESEEKSCPEDAGDRGASCPERGDRGARLSSTQSDDHGATGRRL